MAKKEKAAPTKVVQEEAMNLEAALNQPVGSPADTSINVNSYEKVYIFVLAIIIGLYSQSFWLLFISLNVLMILNLIRKQDNVNCYFSGVTNWFTNIKYYIGKTFFCGSLIEELEKKVKDKEDKCKEEVANSEKKSAKFASELNVLKAEYQKLQEKGKTETNEQVKDSNKKINQLTFELTQARDEYSDMKIKFEDNQKERNKECERLENLEKQRNSDQQKQKELEKKLGTIQTEVKNKYSELEKENVDLRQKNNEMMERIASLKNEMEVQKITLEEKLKKLQMEDECMICQTELKKHERYQRRKNDVFELQCNHNEFHTKCLFKWLEKSPRCPYCNSDCKKNGKKIN